MKISILCASRGRPGRFAQMVESALAMAESAEIEVIGVVDADDPEQLDYLELCDRFECLFMTVGARQPVGHLFNRAARQASGGILMAAGDDVLFRTQGWDRKVRAIAARFRDGLFIASPDNGDGLERVNHWFTGRQWLELFGWFMPAHFEHFGDDRWVQEIARPCGRLVYLRDVLIEHMHKKLRGADGRPKAENDETYRSKRERARDGTCMSERDEALFIELAPQLAADIDKLRLATR